MKKITSVLLTVLLALSIITVNPQTASAVEVETVMFGEVEYRLTYRGKVEISEDEYQEVWTISNYDKIKNNVDMSEDDAVEYKDELPVNVLSHNEPTRNGRKQFLIIDTTNAEGTTREYFHYDKGNKDEFPTLTPFEYHQYEPIRQIPKGFEFTEYPASTGSITLYGEWHLDEFLISKEFDAWKTNYDNGMRHLFIEDGYTTGQLLNLWMQSPDDRYWDILVEGLTGSTSADTPYYINFYRNVKSLCPETIFHGTDTGNDYNTIGITYLQYLEDNGMMDTEEYFLTLQSNEQAKKWSTGRNHDWREDTMTQNFIREFDKLQGEDIMGIYGAGHVRINGITPNLNNTSDPLDGIVYGTEDHPCMANQLNERYPKQITSYDLTNGN